VLFLVAFAAKYLLLRMPSSPLLNWGIMANVQLILWRRLPGFVLRPNNISTAVFAGICAPVRLCVVLNRLFALRRLEISLSFLNWLIDGVIDDVAGGCSEVSHSFGGGCPTVHEGNCGDDI
jgi:hypothetical protein